MVDLTTTYMGLSLRNPLVASASPLTGDVATLRVLEDHGVAAVVLPSLFEEDVRRELRDCDRFLETEAGVAEVCGGFFPTVETGGLVDHYLSLIKAAREALDIPVIASLNGISDAGWTDLVGQLASAGASAIELNLYRLPLDGALTGAEVEDTACGLVQRVRHATELPVAIKLNPYYSALADMAARFAAAGADALVLFNRLYHPDIDPQRLRIANDVELSRRHEMRLPMLWLAALRGRVHVSLAASTGIETSDDAVRYLLAGADVVMSTSALLRHGAPYAGDLLRGLTEWLDVRDFSNIEAVRGLLAEPQDGKISARERAAYRAQLQGYSGVRRALRH